MSLNLSGRGQEQIIDGRFTAEIKEYERELFTADQSPHLMTEMDSDDPLILHHGAIGFRKVICQSLEQVRRQAETQAPRLTQLVFARLPHHLQTARTLPCFQILLKLVCQSEYPQVRLESLRSLSSIMAIVHQDELQELLVFISDFMEFFQTEQPEIIRQLIEFLISVRKAQTINQTMLEVEDFEKILSIVEQQECPRLFEYVCQFFSVWFKSRPSLEYQPVLKKSFSFICRRLSLDAEIQLSKETIVYLNNRLIWLKQSEDDLKLFSQIFAKHEGSFKLLMQCCLPKFDDFNSLLTCLKSRSKWQIESQDFKDGLVQLSNNLWLEKEPQIKLKQKAMKKSSKSSHNIEMLQYIITLLDFPVANAGEIILQSPDFMLKILSPHLGKQEKTLAKLFDLLRIIVQKASPSFVIKNSSRYDLLNLLLDNWKQGASNEEPIIRLLGCIIAKGEEAKENNCDPLPKWLRADKTKDFIAKLQLHTNQMCKSFACKIAQKME